MPRAITVRCLQRVALDRDVIPEQRGGRPVPGCAGRQAQVDELLKDTDPKQVFSSDGLLAEIKKALAERMMGAEIDRHLEAEAAASGGQSGNHRNGYGKKTVITDTSQV